MTTVHISLGRDDGTDQTAAKGVVEWEPTTRREDGTMVILERGFVAPLVEGEATVTVDPSGLTWCWRVTERTDSGGTVRYVAVPDSATTVEYVDLPDVDPTTLVAWSPADPEAAYQAALDAIGGGAGTVTSVDGIEPDESGNVSLSSTYVAQANLTVTPGASVSGSNTGDEPDASTTVKGVVELATTAEATTGTDTTRAVTPAGVAAAIAGVGGGVTDHGALSGLADDDHTQYALADGTRGMFAATSHTHAASQISDSTVTGRALITAATATAARTAISAAPALGSDDNYVTDAEKAALHTHPAVIAQGATQADARTAIGAGTSSFTGDYDDLTSKPTLGDAAAKNVGTTAGTVAAGDDSRITGAAPATGQFPLHTVTPAATVTLSADHPAQSLDMGQDTTIQWPSIAAGQAVLLWLTGAYTPTWDITGLLWAGGTAPTYASAGTLYHLVDMGAAGVMGSGQAYS